MSLILVSLLQMAGVNLTTHHGEDSKDSEKDVLTAKAVAMLVLFTVSMIMGYVPMLMAEWWDMSSQNPRSMNLVGILLGFGGGVLFNTTILHLMPEVAEGILNFLDSVKMGQLNFSLADIMLPCAGFFIMYLVKESVHTYLRKRLADRQLNTNELVENGQTPSCTSNSHAHAGHSHLLAIMDDDFVITSLFEGLAIGLCSADHVWYVFLAVAPRKFVIAFFIGVELIASRTGPCLSVIYTYTFAVMSPIGIGIGMELVGGGSVATSGPMAVILQLLASEILLCVLLFEIEQEHDRTVLWQLYLSILVGFLVIFGLQMLTAHHSHLDGGHGHGHSHNHTQMEQLDHDHDHDHEHEHKYDIVTEAIDKVTDSIAEAVFNAFTSTTPSTIVQPTNVSEISPLHPQRS
ncbi:PREDICTED: zinc transporter ZIP1-like [Vollenhovia emeryi]|uniref:zinc transporter ZIP1-like n=1 Tax=Vollenhovia emeryi TaxID=411798 RepID=UPI0005F39BBB|nr:PREDICTED: zinc transporter ZIP1-like [Vollenhovia emeryi]